MSEPIRVAHVVGKMVGGGVEQVVMNYYRHIDRSRVQFDFLVDADSTLVPKDEIESLGGRAFVIPPYQHLIAHQRHLVKLFREQGWPIVHSHINALSVFPLRAAKKAGVPVRIAHSHSTAGKGEHTKNAVKAMLKRFSNVYPTHRFACSRYAGEWLFGEGVDFEVVYNAVDLQHFSFSAETRAHTRADLGLTDSQFVVGHVGRFTPQKNHQFLIDVFAEVASRHYDAMLLLVGAGETKELVENLAVKRGISDRVRFLGQRSDVCNLYQAFDAFVLPSLYEGLCLVGIEAQRSGLPCFLSDAITREVNVTGEVNFLPIDNPKDWANALDEVYPSRRMAVSDKDFDDYDIGHAAQKLTARYLRLRQESVMRQEDR